MKLTRVQMIAGLSLVLSLSASACDFNGARGGPPSTVSGSASGNLQNGSSEGQTGNWNVVPTASVQATPELDSLALFGSGLLAASAYVRRRRYLS